MLKKLRAELKKLEEDKGIDKDTKEQTDAMMVVAMAEDKE